MEESDSQLYITMRIALRLSRLFVGLDEMQPPALPLVSPPLLSPFSLFCLLSFLLPFPFPSALLCEHAFAPPTRRTHLSCLVLSCLVSRIHRIESDEYGFKSLRARVIIQPRQPRRAGTLAARVEGAVRTEVIRALYTHTHHTHTSHTHNTHAIHTRTRAHAQCHVSSHV
eukprot:COSAG06_NODE_5925_length_3206_cov_2.760541_3_plen_170_part_00